MRDTESVLAGVRALPEPYRTVVWLCDIEELSYQEVSEALSLPLGTVKSRHARGHARLRTAMCAAWATPLRRSRNEIARANPPPSTDAGEP